jgi:hypothetical protein
VTPDTQVPTITDDHLRAINIAAQIELAEGVTTHDYLRLTEIESLLAPLVSGRSVVVDTEAVQSAMRMCELGNFHGAREIMAGWLASPTDKETAR